MASSRKRKAEDSGEGRVASKLPRTSGGASRGSRATPDRQPKHESADIVDLVDVEGEAQYQDFRAKQQAEAIKQQAQEEATRPVKLAEFQCIICMDNPTDLTVTHCGMYSQLFSLTRYLIELGHLFCSECLHQALYAGNGKKACPVCRTIINSNLTAGKDLKKQPKNGVFVLEMKLMTANKKGKQPARVSV